MKRKKILAGILISSYLLSYIIFRNLQVETWSKDGRQYVIFPKSQIWIYYLYRPLTYIDGQVTSMQFHIGAHQ